MDIIFRHDTIKTLLADEKVCNQSESELYLNKHSDLNLRTPSNRTSTCKEQAHPYQDKIPLTQKYAGPRFGFGFVAQFDLKNTVCPQNDGLAYILGITSIYDELNADTGGVKILLNHDVKIILEAVITISEKDIKKLDRVFYLLA